MFQTQHLLKAQALALGAALLGAGCGQAPSDPSDPFVESPVAEITSGAVYVLKNVSSGKCVDITGNSTLAGANVEQWDCNGQKNQQYKFTNEGNGWYQIQPMNSTSECVDVFQASLADGGNVDQWTCNGHTSQRFKLTQPTSGKFEIIAENSGKCLDVAGASLVRGANIQQWGCSGANNQLFTFTPVGSSGTGGSGGSGGTSGGTGGSTGGTGGTTACGSQSGLSWHSANKTWFTSYPAPGSEECIAYSGCQYEGQFSACDQTETLTWVKNHNIASFFPAFSTYKLHDLCIRSGSKSMIVTVYDTCADSDCSGCCTENRGSADALIDLESFTNARFNVPDGPIQWADLGPTKGSGCN